MANTRNAVIRYRILDRCFSNRRVKYDIEKLIEAVSRGLADLDEEGKAISRATVYADIAFMKSAQGYNVDLDENFKDGRTRYYRYTDPDFSINNLPLTEAELNQLQTTVSTLLQFKGLPQFGWIDEMVSKLRQGISTEQNHATIIDFDSNRYLRGIEHIGALYDAIYYKRVLTVSYQPYEQDQASDITIHPYYLKQYNNRWFLFGHDPNSGRQVSNLALDRILTLKEVRKKYVETTTDWNEYFEDIIGVTREERGLTETITLHFFDKTGRYVETKPMHGSQKAKWLNSRTLEVQLSLVPNYEFYAHILSYGNNVKVLSPKKIADTVKKRLIEALANY